MAASGKLPYPQLGKQAIISQVHLVERVTHAGAKAFGMIFTPFTGVRIGELRNLRWENVSMAHTAYFYPKKLKKPLESYDSSGLWLRR